MPKSGEHRVNQIDSFFRVRPSSQNIREGENVSFLEDGKLIKQEKRNGVVYEQVYVEQNTSEKQSSAAATGDVTNLIVQGSSSGEADITGITAGTGLTGGGASGNITLNVVGGTGITANANDIAIDSTVVTLTGTQTLTNKTLTAPTFTGTAQGASLTLTGDLTVQGDTTTLNTATLQVEDKNIVLNYHASSDTSGSAEGAGITIQDAVDASTDATILWDQNPGEFDFSHAINVTGNISVSGTVDGRDIATDGSKLDGIEALADITDTANVTAAGALMDSELTSIADVKALDQSVISGASPTFSTSNMTDASNKRFMSDAQETVLNNTSGTNTGDESDASASVKGIVELATTAETTTGTDTTRAVTPDGLKDGYQGSTNVTTLGTISTGTWNGTAIASAYLDADTAHLSGTQTFTGAKTFNSLTSFTMDGNTISGIDDSSEFTNNDSHIMTSAAVEDKILSYGYITQVGIDEILAADIIDSTEAFSDSDDLLMTAKAINDRIESFGYGTGTMSSWTLEGDSGSTTVTNANTVDIAGGTGITTAASLDAGRDTVTINFSAGIDDLSDVTINSGTLANGQILEYSTAESAFVNATNQAITMSGSTTNGVLTRNTSTQATVESNLTFDGSTLTINNPNAGVAALDFEDTSDLAIFVPAAQTSNYYQPLIGVGENSTTFTAAISSYDAGGSAAQGLAFHTGNTNAITEAMRIDSSQNVGIGTTSPDYELHVAGSIKADTSLLIGSNSNFLTTQLKVGDGTRDIRLNANHSSNAVVGTVGSHDFNIMTANTFRMTIDDSGSVGIGNTSPDATFHVGDNSSSFTLGTTSGDSIDLLKLETDSTNANQLIFSSERVSDGSTWTSTRERIRRRVDTSNMGYIQFGSSFDATNAHMISFGEVGVGDYMGITGDGKIGIGTTSPSQKLHVNGNIRTDSAYYVDGNIVINTDGNFEVHDTRSDTPSTDLGLKGVRFDFKNNSADGLSDGGSYHGVMTFQQWNDTSGGHIHALGFTDNGNVHHRNASIGGTFGNWKRLIQENESGDVVLDATSKLYLDGGTHTYIHEQADDILEIVVGGEIQLKLTEAGNGVEIPVDSHPLKIGAGSDLQLNHNGTDSFVENYTGQLNIINNTDDGDIVFKSDNGSGGLTNYIQLDGSEVETVFNQKIKVEDSKKLAIGSGRDFSIEHDGSHNYMKLNNGNLYFRDQSNNNIFQIYREGGGIQLSEGDLKIPATSKFYLDGGGNSYIQEESADNLIFRAAGGNYLRITGSNIVLNDPGASYDVRIEGDTDSNLFFTDGSADRVGIGTNSPATKLDIRASGANGLVLNNDTSDSANSARLFFEGTSTSTIFQEGSDLSFRVNATTASSSGTERVVIREDGLFVPNASLGVGTGPNSNNGRITASSHIRANNGTGGCSLTANDGGGNASITFNHESQVPEQDGNSARIHVNTDSSSDCHIEFEVASGVTDGSSVSTTDVCQMRNGSIDIQQKLRHLGDTNTLMEFGTDTISFDTGGTEALRIDSSQNVGIGNTSPSRPLQIGTTTTNGEAIKLDGNASYGATIYYSRGGSYNWLAGVGGASSGSSNIPSSYWGIEDVSQSNAVRLAIAHTTGRIGINTNPGAFLDITKDNNNSGNQFRVGDTEGGSAAVRTYSTSDGTGLIINHYYAVGGSPYMRYTDFVSSMGDSAATSMRFFTKPASANPAEALRIDNTQDAHFDQDVIAFSTTPSDIRLKENFEKIENGLDIVSQLEGHTFNWKKGGERLSAGFKAQEVEKILPHLVDEKKLPLRADDDKEYKILRYEEMIPYLVEAIKQLKTEIEELKNG